MGKDCRKVCSYMWTVFKAAPSTTEYFDCVYESIVFIGMMRNEIKRLYRCVVCDQAHTDPTSIPARHVN